jgi:endonuclease YncB( thermonuclease family)
MNTTDFDKQSLWHFRAYVVRVIDGDTFVAMCDTGFWGRYEAHIRINGVAAPEIDADGGIAAQMWLRANLPNGIGWPLRIVTLQRERAGSEIRSFERFVANVFVVRPDGSLQDLNVLLGDR